MARRTIESVASQLAPDVTIVVSDNSTDQLQRDSLANTCASFADVHYLSAPGDLAMTDHWSWAFGQLRERFPAPLTTMVTDRMVMRPGALAALLKLADAHPGRLVSYNHDAVDDTVTPVRLRLQERSERAFELSVDRLLHRCSHLYFHAAIPRVMNCIVPESLLESVERRFGSLFASISPDHCFGFRCLDLLDTIIYFDSCPLVHYGLARSNGESYARGVQSSDGEDFQRHLGGTPMNASAPVPAFHSLTNAVVNEYCFVRDESPSGRLPPLEMTRYLGAMARDTSRLEDPALRAQMRRLLDEQGWRRKRFRYWPARARDLLELLLQRPGPFLRLLQRRLLDRMPNGPASRLGADTRQLGLASTEEALEYLMSSTPGPVRVHVHLLPLVLPADAAREVTPPPTYSAAV